MPATAADEGLVTLGDLADAAGVPAETLADWATRFGFPVPLAVDDGLPLYPAADVELIEHVLGEVRDGRALPDAVHRARNTSWLAGESIYHALRRDHPALPVREHDKRELLAQTRLIERAIVDHADGPLLLAGFQHERFYDASAALWQAYADRAAYAIVFADFARAAGGPGPLKVAGRPRDPVVAEWFLICLAPGGSIVLATWELPRPLDGRDAGRRFRSICTTDPAAVAAAAMAAYQQLASADLDVADRVLQIIHRSTTSPATTPPPLRATLEQLVAAPPAG